MKYINEHSVHGVQRMRYLYMEQTAPQVLRSMMEDETLEGYLKDCEKRWRSRKGQIMESMVQRRGLGGQWANEHGWEEYLRELRYCDRAASEVARSEVIEAPLA